MVLLLALICPLIPLVLAERHGLVPYASPLHLTALLGTFGVTLKVVAFQSDPDLAFHLAYTADPGALLWGVFYVALFVTCLCLGYLSLCRGQGATRIPTPDRSAMLACAGALLALAITHILFAQRGLSLTDPRAFAAVNSVKQYAVNADNVGATGALIKLLYAVPKLLLVLCILSSIRSGRLLDALSAALLFLTLMLAALATGDRFDLVRLLLVTLLAASLSGWRFRLRSALLGAGLLALSIGAVGVMSAWRHDGESGFQTALVAGSGAVTRQVTGSTYFLDANVPTILTARMTPAQRLHGDSYGWWVFGWVPRAFWPDKPSTDVGSYLKRDILGHGPNALGAINVTGPGEAFINFGWWGALVGLALGVAFRVMELATLGSLWPCPLLYPIVVMPLVIAWLQSSFSAALVSAGFTLLLTAMTLWVLRQRANPVAVTA